jgi:O-antigen ligase
VAGFVFGTAALVLLTTHYGRRRSNVLLGVAMLGAVILTGSRTTIVGLLCAGIASMFLKSSSTISKAWMTRFRTFMIIGVVLFIPFQHALRVQIFEPEVITKGIDLFSNPDEPRTQRYDPRTANALTRFQLWGEGTDRFLSSPFVGTGAFRFNDDVENYWGVGGLILLANDGRSAANDSTAHNSYVHIAAETGLLGLFLLLGTWFAMARQLRHQRNTEAASPQIRSEADGATIVLAFAMGTGLTSSSLMTPGLCIPVLLYVGSVALRGDLPRPARLLRSGMTHARSQHQ